VFLYSGDTIYTHTRYWGIGGVAADGGGGGGGGGGGSGGEYVMFACVWVSFGIWDLGWEMEKGGRGRKMENSGRGRG